jgi:DNA-directed RNA polymerase specialized sigma24 family protein
VVVVEYRASGRGSPGALAVHLTRVRDTDAGAGDEELVRRLEVGEATGRLADSDHEVLRLRYWEDLTGAQLGEALGCSGPPPGSGCTGRGHGWRPYCSLPQHLAAP